MQIKRYLFSILAVLACHTGFGQIGSDFSTNDDGWTVFDSNAGASLVPTYNATGGNPGGNIGFTTSSGSLNFSWTAPAKFQGDQSRSYTQTLSFSMISSSGTDNTQNDVVISSSLGTLVFQLPSKPGSGWTNYSIQLLETAGWHFGSFVGAAPTRDQMKAVLANITNLRIRLKYLSGNTGPYTAQFDNVVLNQQAVGTPPTITSFSPSSALKGTNVTINGTNFNTTVAQNAVYFNGLRAAVQTATATQLVVKSPTSAALGQITVVNLGTGLQALSAQNFSALFDNNKDFGGQIIPSTMAAGNKVLLQTGTETGASYNVFGGMDKGDFDNDGWMDLAATDAGTSTIYVYRNLGSGGTISTASFATAQALPAMTGIPTFGLAEMIAADIDNDGLLDIAASVANGTSGYYAVYRNTSTPGNISFAPAQLFAYPYYSRLSMTGGDLDGDGRIDLLAVTGTSPSNIYICQNLSTPGNIDFAYGKTFAFAGIGSYSDILVHDMNNDGKPEIIAPHYGALPFQIFENASTPGTITMNTPFNYAPATNLLTNTKFTIGDIDADNKPDMVWSASGSQYVYFCKNNYDGITFDATTFSAEMKITSSGGSPESLTLGDVNGDGKPEIICSGTNDMLIYENVGATGALSTSSFLAPVIFQGSAGGQAITGTGVTFTDLDGDNKPEVCYIYQNNNVTAVEKGLYVFHNESFPLPKISSVSPAAAAAGNTINLTGTLLKTGATTPTVITRLGKFKGTSQSVTNNTTATFTVPVGAQTSRITYTEHGLTAFTKELPITFSTNRTIDATSFPSSVDFALANGVSDALDVADFDNDGKPDVVTVANFLCKVFQNTHTTSGQPVSSGSLTLLGTSINGQYNAIPYDIDGDGLVDLNGGNALFKGAGSPGTISFPTAPNGTYTTASGFNDATAADLNKDGKVDLIVANGSANIAIYENKSTTGNFSTGSGIFSTMGGVVNLPRPDNYGGIVAEDFDNDGYEDLIATNPDYDNYTIYLNQKVYGPITASSFNYLGEYSCGDNPYDLTASDFDGDGKIDIAITYYNVGKVSVLRNMSVTGDISFSSALDLTAVTNGYAIKSQDLDGDGKPEIIVIHKPNPGPGSFTVFQNTSSVGSVSFAAGVNYPLTTQDRNPTALAIADINLDNKPDIIIAGTPHGSTGNAVMVFENKISTGPVITVNLQPSDVSVCDGSQATYSTDASGTTNITYQWQYSTNGITFNDIADNTNYSGTTTKTLTVNATIALAGRYRCKIGGDLATTVYSNDEGLFVNSIPNPPGTTGGTSCNPKSFALLASGASNGQYRWYTALTGGVIAGETNSTYNTTTLSTTTTFYVSISISGCESTRSSVTATVSPLGAPQLTFDPDINSNNNVNLCGTDHVMIQVSGNYQSYDWSDGSSGTSIDVGTAGTYSVTVSDASGCQATSADIVVTVNPYPTSDITPGTNSLTASSGDSYQWYAGGEAISGATDKTLPYNVFEYGVYAVDVTVNGCTTHSIDFINLITGNQPLPESIIAYPNPVSDKLMLENTSNLRSIVVYDLLGAEVNVQKDVSSNRVTLHFTQVKSGEYTLALTTSDKKIYYRIIKK